MCRFLFHCRLQHRLTWSFRKNRSLSLLVSLCLLLLLSSWIRSNVQAQTSIQPMRAVRAIFPNEWRVSYPAGIAYSATRQHLFLLDARTADVSSGVQPKLVTMTAYEDWLATTPLPFRPDDAMNMAFDDSGNRLFVLNHRSGALLQMNLGIGDILDPTTLSSSNIKRLELIQPAGIAVDVNAVAGTKQLLILDASSRQVVRMDLAGSLSTSGFEKLDLTPLVGSADLRGLAVDPATHHLLIASPGQKRLYEVTSDLGLVAQYDFSALGLADPRAWAAIYSSDTTDAPQTVHLLVADDNSVGANGATLLGQVLEVELGQAANSHSTTTPNVVSLTQRQSLNLSSLLPPSANPSGVSYWADSDSLLVTDSEIDEIPAHYNGSNLFGLQRNGALAFTKSSGVFSTEPTDVALNPSNQHLFYTDSLQKIVVEVAPGADGVRLTDDDVVTSFPTDAFAAHAPDGIAVDAAHNRLWLVDRINAEIYQIDVGANGLFDGVATAGGDDSVISFDTLHFGLYAPEAVALDAATGNLLLTGRQADRLFEVTQTGTLVREWVFATNSLISPSGLALVPSSGVMGGISYFITDRGIDNDRDPNENDGRLLEFVLAGSAPSPTITPVPTDTPVGTPTPVATVPANATVFYLSSSTAGMVDNLSFGDEDILLYNTASDQWSKFFDGSDMGLLANDVDGFDRLNDGKLLISLNLTQTIEGVGEVTPNDILQFIPTSLGNNTQGRFEWFLDGSDVGLDDPVNEDIDSISFTTDRRLLISTRGSFRVFGLQGADEDLIALDDGIFGPTSAGTWSAYFDGSDVGLQDVTEDLRDVQIDPNDLRLYLTIKGAYTVTDANGAPLSGDGDDILLCVPSALGNITHCSFSLLWDGDANGFGGEMIDSMAVGVGIPSLTANNSTSNNNTEDNLNDPQDGVEDDSETESSEEDARQQLFLPVANR